MQGPGEMGRNYSTQSANSYCKGLTRWSSIKPFDFFDVMRGKLRQHVAVSRVNLGHRRLAILVDADVGFVSIAAFHASGKIHDADTYAGEGPGGHVVPVPVTVAEVPLPRQLIQARAERVRGRKIADERVGSGHGCRRSKHQ